MSRRSSSRRIFTRNRRARTARWRRADSRLTPLARWWGLAVGIAFAAIVLAALLS